MKKMLTLFLSIVLLLTPIMAGAESANGYYYFSLSNPILEIVEGENVNTLDLSGLELKLAAAESANGFDVMAALLANGQKAIAGYLGMDETAVYAIVDGMQSSLSISLASLQDKIESSVEAIQQSSSLTISSDASVIGGADGPTSITINGENLNLDELFTEEALAAFEAAMADIASSIEVSEPVADVVLEGEVEVPAQRVDYTIGTDAVIGFFNAVIDLCMSNEQIAAEIQSSLTEEGYEDVDLKDMVAQIKEQSAPYLDGSVFMTEAGNLYTDNYLYFAESFDESGAPVYAYVNVGFCLTSDEDGQYIYLCVYPTEEEAIELWISSMQSSEVEGAPDIYVELTAYELSSDTYEPVTRIAFTFYPYYDEAGVINTLVDLSAYSEGEEVSFGLNYYGDKAAHGGYVYVIYSDGETVQDVTIGYDGVCSEDGTTYTGEFWGTYSENEVIIGALSSDIAFGIDTTGESIAYDFSSVPTVDFDALDDETLESLQTDLLNAATNGFSVIFQQLPSLATMLMGAM